MLKDNPSKQTAQTTTYLFNMSNNLLFVVMDWEHWTDDNRESCGFPSTCTTKVYSRKASEKEKLALSSSDKLLFWKYTDIGAMLSDEIMFGDVSPETAQTIKDKVLAVGRLQQMKINLK